MNISYSDSEGRLDRIMTDHFRSAAEYIIDQELPELTAEMKCCDVPIEISVTVVNGDEIRAINSEYRGIDKVTDVLSFPQYDDRNLLITDIRNSEAEGFDIPLGDVVVCYDRAAEQSTEYGITLEREITYLFVHSALHLLGYDHMEEEDRSVMRTHEESVMEEIGLGR